MKKRVVLICMLLVGAMSIVGCSNSNKNAENTNKTEDSRTSKNDSNTNKDSSNKNNNSSNGQAAPKDDALAKGELTEDDIVSKRKENLGGQDVTIYELKDGSAVVGTDGNDDLDSINNDLKYGKKETQEF